MIDEPTMNVEDLLKALAAALAGEGPAIRLSAPEQIELVEAPDGIAVVVSTSGSTGTPKQTMLSVDALAASSMGTAIALRGEGQWLLALPLSYVAGIQVLIRSLFAGTRPEVMAGKFSAEAFAAAAAEMTDPLRFTSLVPTQLQRLLEAPVALPALQRFNAVLLGGAPASERLLTRAQDAGVTVVTTYGSAETCGGCVYNGEPLHGVEISLDEGRILLGGDVVAAGYFGDAERTENAFRERNGNRWYRTEDLGEIDDDGKLRVTGRADDVLISGGLKISASLLAEKLCTLDDVQDAFVTGIEDPEWGEAVLAAVQLAHGSQAGPGALRCAAKDILPAHEVPKRFVILEEFPLLPHGKLDRQALLARLRSELSHDIGKNRSK